MADNKKTPDEDDYPEDYYKGEEYRPPEDMNEPFEPGEKGSGDFLSKKVYMIIGILLAIGLVYWIVARHNASKNASLASATPTVETGTVTTLPSTTSTFQAQPQLANQVGVTTPPSSEQNTLVVNQTDQQSIANLQGQVQQLQGQINDISRSISTLNNQIQVMANEIRAIAVGRQLPGRGIGLTTAGIAYQLKAIVPGRAWLQSKDGNTTTVTIGDRLPGYGIIQMINTQQGIVTTSSGIIIQYGPKDS